jgi:DNA (cytosine-5)-methyltransferase 1
MKDTHVDNTITTLEFCAGYGGIGLGLKNIFGERLRCLAYCELEGFAQANLISKMEKGLLDVAPLWNDLKTFPYGKFHGLVDILIAGYPCQPFSAAGKRLGTEDPRHLWPHIARSIGIIRPRMCFFENVEGHISLGLREVVGELEQIGYSTAWGIFSASEIGAPHERRRVFVLAVLDYTKLAGLEGHFRANGDEGRWEDEDRSTPAPTFFNWRRIVFADECEQCEFCDEIICPNCCAHYADCGCPGPTQDGIECLRIDGIDYGRSETIWPQYPAHGIKDCEPPRLVTPSKSSLGGDVDGLTYRVDRLRLLGNGVVPATAERAFRVLMEELSQEK